MPTTPLKNRCYRALLPFAPSPRGQMTHTQVGEGLRDLAGYERLLCQHHVLGASLLLTDGQRTAGLLTSVQKPAHIAAADTWFRVASITKLTTALVILRLQAAGRLSLADAVTDLLPTGRDCPALAGITVRHLLTHTSGLADLPAVDEALLAGEPWSVPLRLPGIRPTAPGERFHYSNFAFGLLGCVMEAATGLSVAEVFRRELAEPLGLRAELDVTTLQESQIMPISRVLPYRRGRDVRVTAIGARPLSAPDPLRHYGHTAGGLYTDAASLMRVLRMVASGGILDGTYYLPAEAIRDLTALHAAYGAADPRLTYGLGTLRVTDTDISPQPLLGHQGFAWGCADGAFIHPETGWGVVFLNGGSSEAREGRLGVCNQALLRWAFREELPRWR